MDVAGFLHSLTADPAYAGQLCYRRTVALPPLPRVPVPAELEAPARAFLRAQGIGQLYAHQAAAIQALLAGQDVVVTTGPASGKSLCYQVPLVQTLSADHQATALLIFPTKALARSQQAAWNEPLDRALGSQGAASLRAMTLDGDTPADQRRLARARGRVLITTPEMLHASLLPQHAQWARFLHGLRYLVLDEVHVYTGFFGAGMANVLRRLQRLAQVHGACPRAICTSATLANPEELAAGLLGRPARHVAAGGGLSGRRTFAVWNPPRIQARRWRGRRSANVEAHELMTRLLKAEVATICFTKARNTAEMLYRYVRAALAPEAPELAARVVAYRGGYSAPERRQLEAELRAGRLLGVCTTRALELGIDLGTMDACIIVGYPGTLNSFFQQAGRVGRSGRDALIILVTLDTPINQYVAAHPEFLFARPLEQAVVESDNPFVAMMHVACAAAELPLTDDELPLFGYAAGLAAEVLAEHGDLARVGPAWHHTGPTPAARVRLRGYGDQSTVVMDADTGRVIDRLDRCRALRLFYPGAVYLRGGQTYAMVEHDLERNVVRVRRAELPYYTDPLTSTAVDHVDVELDSRPVGTATACLGEVYAVASTPLYERVQFYTLERLSQHRIDQPPFAYEAMAFWLRLPAELPVAVARLGLNPDAGMLGVLFCVSRVLPLFLASDAGDFDWSLGARNTPWHTLFWFEFFLRGIGSAERCYRRLEEILELALEHLLTCDCPDGCPNCAHRLISPYHVRNVELGEGNVGSRRAAAVILQAVLRGASAEAALAALDQPRPRGQAHLPTVAVERWRQQPQRLPLDEHTRLLLRRKLERMQAPPPLPGHAVAMAPPHGIPPPAPSPPPVAVQRPAPPAEADGALHRRLRQRLRGE